MINNVNRKTVLIYESLPCGGARNLYDSNIKYLKTKYDLFINSNPTEIKLRSESFLNYMIYVVFKSSNISVDLLGKLKSADLVIAYHSWVTKSPSLLRQNSIPEIYICHEVPREFYDKRFMSLFSLKDIIVNKIRLVIKYIDYINVTKNKNLVIVANSKFSAEIINKVYRVKSKVIYPGIDLGKYRDNNIYSNRKNQIITVGAVNKLKNQSSLLEIVSRIDLKIRPDLLIVGNGSDKIYEQKLYTLARELGVNIQIELNLNEKELIEAYRSSKVFCYAPINEPFGIVVLEAMRAGLPIVASAKSGGFNEIVGKRSGYIIPREDYSLWKTKLESLLTNRDEWEKISKFNYKYVEKFSENIMNKKLLQLITKLLKKS